MKRQFPYHSQVAEIGLKQRTIAGSAPGRERQDPAVFEHRPISGSQAATGQTDFSQWSEAQIKAFLDQRGEDHDDCVTLPALIQRAQHCEYMTGPARAKQAPPAATGIVEEDDPLDAFMAEINQEVQADKPASAKPKSGLELDEEDNVADFLEARRRNGGAAAAQLAAASAAGGDNSDEEVYAAARAADAAADAADGGYDSDDAPATAGAVDRKKIEPLPPLDHADIDYADFEKDFYDEADAIANLSLVEVNAQRREAGIRVTGFDAPRPIANFAQCGFDAALMGVIRKAGYQKPTPIQAQALPAALSGRDVLGIAKTGSGKTAAFVLPMVVHIMDQPELNKGEGPIGVVVAPTRELAEQIHREARKFGKPYSLRVCAAFGGLSKFEQFKELKTGAEVAVCTPGRMIDLIKMKACTMRRTTFLVFDEADRMFDMGFEPQVRSIIGQVRPDRQTLLFSATMPMKVENLVRDALTSPVRVTVGEVGAANEDIRQVAEVVEEAAKVPWLLARLPGFVDAGDVLVFAAQKARVDEVVEKLKADGARAAGIHGDMDQHSRMAVLRDFKAGTHHVLVATDVAARGLDIASIKTVVNLDAAKDIDTHVHRVGRTGRAGDKDGSAFTLVTPREARFAGDLVNSLAAAAQEVPQALLDLAATNARFRKGGQGGKSGKGGRGGRGGGRGGARRAVGGSGLGFGGAGSMAGRGNSALLASLAASAREGGGAQCAPKAQQSAGAAAFESGFSRGGFESTVEGTATPASARPTVAESGPAHDLASLPPPPDRAEWPPPGTPDGLPAAAPHAAPVPAAARAPAAAPTPPAAPQADTWGGSGLKSAYAGRFSSTFVASGSTGGDQSSRATIVAPRAASNRPVPPPPQPLRATVSAAQLAMARPALSAAAAAASPAAQAAISAAQAIAARLTAAAAPAVASVPGSYGHHAYSYASQNAAALSRLQPAGPRPSAPGSGNYTQQPYAYGAAAGAGLPSSQSQGYGYGGAGRGATAGGGAGAGMASGHATGANQWRDVIGSGDSGKHGGPSERTSRRRNWDS